MKKVLLIALVNILIGGSLIAQQDIKTSLEEYLYNVDQEGFDKVTFLGFVEGNKESFLKGGLGDLDTMMFNVDGSDQTYASLMQEECVDNNNKNALLVLQTLNEFRTNKLTEQEIGLLDEYEYYFNSLLFGCLISDARHDELDTLVKSEDEFKKRKILSRERDIKGEISKVIDEVMQMCPSLRLMPYLNTIGAKYGEDFKPVTDKTKATAEQEAAMLALNLLNGAEASAELPIEMLRMLKLDVDSEFFKGSSIGQFIDGAKKAADKELARNSDNDDCRNLVAYWKKVQETVAPHRSKRDDWVFLESNDHKKIFVNKVFEYLNTGNENILKNIRHYNNECVHKKDSTKPMDYSICYNQFDDTSLSYVINILRNRDEDFDVAVHARNLVAPDVMNCEEDLQGEKTNDQFGKEVAGELLVSLLKEPCYEKIAKKYYKRFKPNIDEIRVEDENGSILFSEFFVKHPDDDACKKIRAIINGKNVPADPKKSSKNAWSTTQKVAVSAFIIFGAYVLYSRTMTSIDDADTTAA